MAVPPIALIITYWLHMLATVVWIGSLTSLGMIVIPSARKALRSDEYRAFLAHLQVRLQPVIWFCLVVLAGTGMFQMSAHPSYEGFLAITNAWSAAILFKHISIGLLLLTSGYMTWGIIPALQKVALRKATGQSIREDDIQKLEKKEARLLFINLALSVVILALTAWARAAG